MASAPAAGAPRTPPPQLERVEDVEDHCHQPDEDSNGRDPATDPVQAVPWAVSTASRGPSAGARAPRTTSRAAGTQVQARRGHRGARSPPGAAGLWLIFVGSSAWAAAHLPPGHRRSPGGRPLLRSSCREGLWLPRRLLAPGPATRFHCYCSCGRDLRSVGMTCCLRRGWLTFCSNRVFF